jgi:hypothetical protein
MRSILSISFITFIDKSGINLNDTWTQIVFKISEINPCIKCYFTYV